MLDLAAAFITLTTLLTYINYRFVRLPPTIGVMATALVLSLILQGLAAFGYVEPAMEMQEIVRSIDFSEVLMQWFLPALLFAGALHVNLGDLKNYRWPIAFLATGGVLESTARALFVHPNTVRYRLRRVGEITGLSPTVAREAFTLHIALTIGRLDPSTAQHP